MICDHKRPPKPGSGGVKTPSPELLAKKIQPVMDRMTARAKELGWSPNQTAEESKAAIKQPTFVYAKLESCWGPWKKGKDGNKGGFIIRWGAEKVGFGEFTFSIKNRKAICATECMSEGFVRAAIDHFLRTSVVYEHR